MVLAKAVPKLEFAKIRYVKQPPKADALVESLRAIGYTVGDAIADLIDNSVAAKAKNIWLDFEWGPRGKVLVTLRDDGNGMTPEYLEKAMTVGGRRPSEERERTDLGRYSMGLKTASWSQAKGLAVISKTTGTKLAAAFWDLDHVAETGEWDLGIGCPEEARAAAQALAAQKQGTAVVWYKVDRMVGPTSEDDTATREKFNKLVDGVGHHIRGSFHDFMEKKGLKIHLNGNRLQPWDPCLRKSSELVAEETIEDPRGNIRVEAYILKDHRKMSDEEKLEATHTKGWIEHQGFQVYRANRLILDGTWFGIGAKHPTANAARIALYLPNTMDSDWHVDVKKATMIPPLAVRERLRRIADFTRKAAKDSIRRKGQLERRTHGDVSIVWRRMFEEKRIVYRVNREHHLLKELLGSKESSAVARDVIALVEKALPIDTIRTDLHEGDHAVTQPQAPALEKELLALALEMVKHRMKKGMTRKQAIEFVCGIEPFCDSADIQLQLRDNQ